MQQSISQTGRLLSKLVERENLSCLIVNLHRGNEGYSIALRLPGGLETETMRLPYEDDEFLSFIGMLAYSLHQHLGTHIVTK